MLIWFHMKGLSKFIFSIIFIFGLFVFSSQTAPVADAACREVNGVLTPEVSTSCGTCDPITKTQLCQTDCKGVGGPYQEQTLPCTPTATTTTTTTTTNTSSSGGLGGIFSFFTDKLGELVQNIIGFVIKTLTVIIGGDPKAKPAVGLTTGTTTPIDTLSYMYERYGALGAIGMGVQEMYDNPPVTTVDYLATIAPIAPAFAQETKDGRAVLNPLSGYWIASRNLAYIFFVLVLVAIGLMIMFRSKIDPRTTVTVTAALPNLVVSLILITFSLALAGFIIDVGRIFMELFKSILGGAVTGNEPLPGLKEGVNLSPWSIYQSFIFNLNGGVSFGGTAGAVVGFFVTLIIMFFAFVVGIQVFIMLLFRYINLILKPIFAPFVFLFGALPGRGGNAGNWFKGYLVDALTFPLVFLVLNLALSIKNIDATISNDPFGVFIGGANLNSIVAIGVLFMATKIPALLEDAMDIKPSSHVDKSGSQPGQMLKQVPIVKNLL